MQRGATLNISHNSKVCDWWIDGLCRTRSCHREGKNSWLKLSLSKIEVILGAEESTLKSAAKMQLPLEGAHPELVNSVLLDSLLTQSFHIAASASHIFYHLQLAWRLSHTGGWWPGLSFIQVFWSCLDYSNAVHLDMKPSARRKLQLVQSAAACLLRNHELLQAHQTYHPLPSLVPHRTESSSRSWSLPSGCSVAWSQHI